MKVTDFVLIGGFESEVARLRVYRNEQFSGSVADPAGWRLIADLACSDEAEREGAAVTLKWRAPDFEVEPGGLYCFLLCDGSGRPLIVLSPEGLAVPEGVGRMKYSEWQMGALSGATPAEGGK